VPARLAGVRDREHLLAPIHASTAGVDLDRDKANGYQLVERVEI
jgi:hypothetical protein